MSDISKRQRQHQQFSERLDDWGNRDIPANTIDNIKDDFRKEGLEVPAWIQNIHSSTEGIEITADEVKNRAKKWLIKKVLLALVLLGLWIWALVATIINWKRIPLWAKIIAIIGLVVTQPLVNFSIGMGTSNSPFIQLINFTFKMSSIIILLMVYLSRTPQ